MRSVKIDISKEDRKFLEKLYGHPLTVYDAEEAAKKAWELWIENLKRK